MQTIRRAMLALTTLVGTAAAVASEPSLALLGDRAADAPILHQSAAGSWLGFDNGTMTGAGCAVVFRQKDRHLAFAGPDAGRPGSIVFSGPDVPATFDTRDTDIELIADGKPISLRATLVGKRGGDNFLIVPTAVDQTIKSIGDSEAISIRMGDETVFSIKTEGGHKARDALLRCLAGQKMLASTPEPKMASLPSPFAGGSATIKGRLWTKHHWRATSTYPPRGTPVAIALLTDEVKKWLEESKKSGNGKVAVPASPEVIRNLHSTETVDDQGSFTFPNLKPGTYLLFAHAGMKRVHKTYDKVGRVDSYIDGQHVDGWDEFAASQSTTVEATLVTETVTIGSDGQAVEVDLKKSRVWDFPWW